MKTEAYWAYFDRSREWNWWMQPMSNDQCTTYFERSGCSFYDSSLAQAIYRLRDFRMESIYYQSRENEMNRWWSIHPTARFEIITSYSKLNNHIVLNKLKDFMKDDSLKKDVYAMMEGDQLLGFQIYMPCHLRTITLLEEWAKEPIILDIMQLQYALHLTPYLYVNRMQKIITSSEIFPFFLIPIYRRRDALLPRIQAMIAESDFFLKESLTSGWLGDIVMLDTHFCADSGIFTYCSSMDSQIPGSVCYRQDQGQYCLLRWKQDEIDYGQHLVETNFFSFCELMRLIPEYKEENPYAELSLVGGMGGKFFRLIDNGIVKGGCCMERIGDQFVYVSYVAILPDYRKTNASEQLLHSLFTLGNHMKKDILIAVIEDKIKPLYTAKGFVECGYWSETK